MAAKFFINRFSNYNRWSIGWVSVIISNDRWKSQLTPITKGGTSQSNLHWTFFTRLLLHTVTGSILNSYTDLPFFTGHLGPFIHLGLKWPDEPIKARGVHYSYDIKICLKKKFIERFDSVKKLINICSSRGLFIYGKVTIIKSLIIPKFVYISSLLPVPKEIVKELNQMIFKFCVKEPIKWQDFPQKLTNMKTEV